MHSEDWLSSKNHDAARESVRPVIDHPIGNIHFLLVLDVTNKIDTASSSSQPR